MRAVDTNVLVGLMTRDVPAQVAAAEAFVAPGSDLAVAVDMLLNHQHLTVQDSATRRVSSSGV